MATTKLTTTDAFVVVDIPEASASGMIRSGRKILPRSAADLARSATYTFASFGIQRSGASAGVNAAGSIEDFVTELEPLIKSGELFFGPGKGVAPESLEQVGQWSPLSAEGGSVDALVDGMITAAQWALGDTLSGKTVAIESPDQAQPQLLAALEEQGATIVDVFGIDEKPWLVWGVDVDVLFVGSRPGVLNHQGAPSVTAKVLVPWGPIPITTRAQAMIQRQPNTTIVPDFLATAGYLLAGVLEGGSEAIAPAIVAALDSASEHEDGLFLGACHEAERFLSTWQDKLPFGRPLAA